MYHAEICPVCQGTGEYPNPNKGTLTCHGCEGDGWIEVNNDPIGYRPQPYDCPETPPWDPPCPNDTNPYTPWYPWPYDSGDVTFWHDSGTPFRVT